MNTELTLPILKSATSGFETQNVDSRPEIELLNKAGSISTDSTDSTQKTTAVEEPISNEEINEAVSEINSVVQNLQRDLLFSVDDKTGGTFVKVVDTETDEVIREIPSEEIRDIKAKLEQVAGLFVNEVT